MVIATDSPKPVPSPTISAAALPLEPIGPSPTSPSLANPGSAESLRYSVPQLAKVLRDLIQAQGNGQILLQARDGRSWSLHVRVGRLFWANGGEHRQRRWQRQLMLHGTSLPGTLPPVLKGDGQWLREHQVLAQLVRRQMLPRRAAVAWIEATIGEVLFDIFQAATQIAPPQVSQDPGQQPSQREEPIAILNNSDLFRHAQEQLLIWNNLGLKLVSPNQSPIARDIQGLQNETPPKTFKALARLLTGNSSLRDLSRITQQDLPILGRLLVPYIKSGHVLFQSIGDLGDSRSPEAKPQASPPIAPSSTPSFANLTAPQPSVPASLVEPSILPLQQVLTPSPPPIAAADPSAADLSAVGMSAAIPSASHSVTRLQLGSKSDASPLVLCVDDSTQIAYMVEQMVKPAGYRFLSVQDPVDALSMILRSKPDVILLDLIMPMVYGHEICTQLRRSPLFKTTPIIMITSNPNIIDKAVKGSGATDYLIKPFDGAKLLQTIQRYLPAPTSVTPIV
jgi:two-component system, chemotaxis family, response regulator PixG